MLDSSFSLHFLIFIYVVVIAISAILAGACLEYRRQRVVQVYIGALALYFGLLVSNLFLILSTSFEHKAQFANLRFIFISLTTPCWVYFARELFRSHGDRKSSRWFAVFFIVPLLISACCQIPALFPYVFRDLHPFTALGISTLQWSTGPLLKVHIFQSYILLGISAFYCLRGLRFQQGLKTRYGILLLMAMGLYVVVEMVGIFAIPEIRFLGIPSLIQIFSSIFFFYILHRQQVVRSFSQDNNLIFESLPAPIILVNHLSEVVLYNSRAKDVFFFNLASRGALLCDVLPPQIAKELSLPSDIAPGKIVGMKVDGAPEVSTRYFEVISEPVEHASIFGGGRLLIFNEVTELKRSTQTNQRLMSLMSHDLLGNLSSLEMLTRNRSEAHWDMISDAAKSATDLLKNLLLWSATQADFYAPELEVVCVKELMEPFVKQFYPIAEAKSVKLRCIEPLEPLLIKVDRKMFAAIVRNILSNAIKYAPVNSSIEVECLKGDKATMIQVRDEGPGMDPQIAQAVLAGNRPSARRSNSEGYGIGLFIITHFLRLHGGRLEITSGPYGGCRMTAVFPT